MFKTPRISRNAAILSGIVLLIWLFFAHIYTMCSVPLERMVRGIVLLESDHQLVLSYGEGESLPLTGIERTYCTGFFVGRGGEIETHWSHADDSVETLSSDSVRVLVGGLRSRNLERQSELSGLLDEMDYYQRTHTVSDEGYNEVLELYTQLTAEADSLARLDAALVQALSGKELALRFDRALLVYYRPTVSDSLQCFEAIGVDESHCRLLSGNLPDKSYIFNPTSLRWGNERRLALGYLEEPSKTSDSSAYIPQIIDVDSLSPDFHLPAVFSGAPIVDARAHLRGVCTPSGWVERGGYRFSPRAWWSSFRQWISGWWAQWPDCGGESVVRNVESIPVQGQRPHEGYGTYTDSSGYTYVGEWQADTLVSGQRWRGYRKSVFDTLRVECYEGDFDAQLRPHGEGRITGTIYYEGEWQHGNRHGVGVGLMPGRIVSYGVWKDDRFQGEHIVHHPRRVYGIDISRYQHESGRKVYPIQWSNLRITDLGRKTKKTVDGLADYPVSFCYIKATQGVKTKSDYSTDDAMQARAAGVYVGHYHFFSPLSGSDQAHWFLENATIHLGDLPPMLDVELTQKQIDQMGGHEVMLREMVEWLRVVKARCHTQPVLYVNQSFVDKYMADAPEEVKACPVWVARYSQYRPYVRLVFWQLSYDGIVRGINGGVDIDVFNGSIEQFRDFVKEYCVK